MSKRSHKTQSQVLAVLRRHHDPLSAYDVIGELRQVNPKIAPPTVYRALEALAGQGLVHRLESLKAFVACQHDECQHASIFAICDDCGTVEESFAPDLIEELFRVAGRSGFTPTRHVIELHGLCSSCGTGGIPA
ncbi:MAG: Fur family transcriptional regulator [Cyanobacteria bacterium J06642_2]